MTAVVLAYGEQPFIHDVVDRVLASTGVAAHVVVVDNGCTSPSLEPLRDRPGVTLLEPGTNTGFTGGCNLGAAAATTDFLAFVNSDALVEPGALAELVAVAARPEVGIASASLRLAETPELLNSAGNPVHVLGLSWAGHLGEPAADHPTEERIPSCTGAAIAVRREVWDALGGFTEEFFAYCEDAGSAVLGGGHSCQTAAGGCRGGSGVWGERSRSCRAAARTATATALAARKA